MKFENPLSKYIGKCIKFDLQRSYEERERGHQPAVPAKYYYITGYKLESESDERMVNFEGVKFAEWPISEDEYTNSILLYRDYRFNELYEMRPHDYLNDS